MLPSPDHRGLGLRSNSCRGHLWVHSRCGPVTRSPSQGRFCRLASSASFPPRMQPKLRGSDFSPGGTYLPLNMPAFAGRTMVRNTRELLRRYAREGRLALPIAERDARTIVVEMSAAESALYEAVEDYISDIYNTASQEKRSAVGFVMTIYRRRLASSF